MKVLQKDQFAVESTKLSYGILNMPQESSKQELKDYQERLLSEILRLREKKDTLLQNLQAEKQKEQQLQDNIQSFRVAEQKKLEEIREHKNRQLLDIETQNLITDLRAEVMTIKQSLQASKTELNRQRAELVAENELRFKSKTYHTVFSKFFQDSNDSVQEFSILERYKTDSEITDLIDSANLLKAKIFEKNSLVRN